MANVSSSNSQGVRVPKLRFPGFEGEWKDAKLSDLTTYLRTRGKSYRSHFISTENMKQKCSGIERYEDDSITDGIAFEKGDILLANIRPYLKKVWLSSFSGVCSTDVLAFHPIGADSDFLFSALCRDSFFTYVMSGVKGSKMPRGDKIHIMDFHLAVPDIQEQRKIAQFVQCLNKRIEKQRQLVEALKSYKRGFLNSYISQNEQSWEKVCLSDILSERKEYCEKDGTFTHATLSKDGVYGKTDRYDRDYLVSSDDKKYKVTHRGDLCYNPANLKFGVICINTYGDAIFSPIYVTFEISEQHNTEFVGAYLMRSDFINQALRFQEGTVYERMAVSPDDLLAMSIRLPQKSEQGKIANILSKMEMKIQAEDDVLNKTVLLKKALLSLLFI